MRGEIGEEKERCKERGRYKEYTKTLVDNCMLQREEGKYFLTGLRYGF